MSCLLPDVAMIVLPHHSIMLLYWFLKQMCNPLLLLAWPLNWDAVSDFSHFVNFHHTFGSRPPLFLHFHQNPSLQRLVSNLMLTNSNMHDGWQINFKKKRLATSVSQCFLHQYFTMYLFSVLCLLNDTTKAMSCDVLFANKWLAQAGSFQRII